MKYVHRIAVPTSLCFDLESDNSEPTVAEIHAVIGDLIDGADVECLPGGRVYIETFAAEHHSVEDTVLGEVSQ